MIRSTPSEQGVDAEGIAAFVDALDRDLWIEPHGLIVQRHGARIAEGYWAPHTADRKRLVYSLSKTFTGTALGLALGEGRLSLDDRVIDHLADLVDPATVDERTARMLVRHAASMASGHDREILGEALLADVANPLRAFFRIPPDAEPGTLFAYNQPPVLAVAEILQRLVGSTLVPYLRPRVLDPLGIAPMGWATGANGLDLGFSGLYTNLDAVARLGQLYLDDGVHEGRRLLPEGFVAEASRVQTPNPMREEPDWRCGYGYQLWMSRHGYRGDGAFGQYMVVLPEHDTVIALFSSTMAMQRVLDLLWEHVLPALQPEGLDSRAAGAADDALAQRLPTLAIETAAARCEGAPVAPMVRATLRPGERGPNTHTTITAIDVEGDRVTVHEGDVSFDVRLTDHWQVEAGSHIASSAALLYDGTVALDLAMLEVPHRLEVVLSPSTGTFTAQWRDVPIFRAGAVTTLSAMHHPPLG